MRRARLSILVGVLALAAVLAGAAAADGTTDSRGNYLRAGVTGKPDPYNPGDWLMQLDVAATNVYGQGIGGAPVTFEKACRLSVPCPFKDRPEQVGVTDASGRLTYNWTEHRVPNNVSDQIEGAVHVYIDPLWLSVDVYYTVGTHTGLDVGSE